MDVSFARYIMNIKQSWNPVDVEYIAKETCRCMEQLFSDSLATDTWVTKLSLERPRSVELYRDDHFGFIQMGHFHSPNHKNPPHDHGGHWVVYGVYQGEIEIPKYQKKDDREKLEVVSVDRLRAGTAFYYLPDDIHSTRVISPDGAIVLRFLSCDLKKVKRSRFDWDQVDR